MIDYEPTAEDIWIWKEAKAEGLEEHDIWIVWAKNTRDELICLAVCDGPARAAYYERLGRVSMKTEAAGFREVIRVWTEKSTANHLFFPIPISELEKVFGVGEEPEGEDDRKVAYEGFITADFGRRKLLVGLGIEVGRYEGGRFVDCRCDVEALDRLNSYWGQMYWNLQPVEVKDD